MSSVYKNRWRGEGEGEEVGANGALPLSDRGDRKNVGEEALVGQTDSFVSGGEVGRRWVGRYSEKGGLRLVCGVGRAGEEFKTEEHFKISTTKTGGG